MGSFENKYVEAMGCHYSRIIASWLNSSIGSAVGFAPRLKRIDKGHYEILPSYFEVWLRSLQLTAEEVADIKAMATIGKFELEEGADRFAKANNWNPKKLFK